VAVQLVYIVVVYIQYNSVQQYFMISILSYPSPTSNDIITTNPITTPSDDSFPLPLDRIGCTVIRIAWCIEVVSHGQTGVLIQASIST